MIDTALVERLVAAQFPQWSRLAVRPVPLSGWDNRTFHLGDEMIVRLPREAGYEAQVAKEHRWLPVLAPQLPLPIPAPLAKGEPGEGYPFEWSVYRWIEGENASPETIGDMLEFATDLAGFLTALQRIDATGGPAAGAHNFFRGGPLKTYDAETRLAADVLAAQVPRDAVLAVWEAGVDTTWSGPPVWVHGDVAASNLLVRDGRLAAMIDFGCLGIGDPACDLAIAWTLFSGESRRRFGAALPLDPAIWVRAAGWALWKALVTLAEEPDGGTPKADEARNVIDQILTDDTLAAPHSAPVPDADPNSSW